MTGRCDKLRKLRGKLLHGARIIGHNGNCDDGSVNFRANPHENPFFPRQCLTRGGDERFGDALALDRTF